MWRIVEMFLSVSDIIVAYCTHVRTWQLTLGIIGAQDDNMQRYRRDHGLKPSTEPPVVPKQLLSGIGHRWKSWTGWWFGCHFWHFPRNIGLLIIPIDELIFFRGVAQPPTSEGSHNSDSSHLWRDWEPRRRARTHESIENHDDARTDERQRCLNSRLHVVFRFVAVFFLVFMPRSCF